MAADVATQMDPFFLALSRARRRRFDDCVEQCTELLNENPYDQVGGEMRVLMLRIHGVQGGLVHQMSSLDGFKFYR